MKRREIIHEAKRLVAHSGAYNVLEFGEELFLNYCPNDDPRYPFAEEIVEEACKQAYRVIDFLKIEED